MDIYGHKNYTDLLETWCQGPRGVGAKSRLAVAAGCSPSWITRVLSGTVHLTPDQAYGISQGMLLSESETEYFLLLLDKERASTLALKKRIEKKLQALRQEALLLSPSLASEAVVAEQGAVAYYSSWIYPAIHTVCMIEGMTILQLARILRLQEAVLAKGVSELKKMGILRAEGEFLIATSLNVHLPAEHVMTKTAHINWRAKTINFFQDGNESGLHYSAVHCLSQKDFAHIQGQLKEAIVSCRKQIQDSECETVAVFCVDWYQL